MSDIDEIVDAIDQQLPQLAQGVIERHLDLNDPENRRFFDQPDEREHHQTDWHQWGIITHTRVFLRHYSDDIDGYLCAWGVQAAVRAQLRKEIDGIARGELLRVSILLHDIGKFGARFRGKTRFHFTHHEALSGEILRSEIDLRAYGLTPAQIEYVARTAEDHFVLGLVRQRMRSEGRYGDAFVRSAEFEHIARAIIREHRDDAIEIGVLFLGDSLAKVGPRSGPERAVSQYEMNIAVARRFLEIVAREEGTC